MGLMSAIRFLVTFQRYQFEDKSGTRLADYFMTNYFHKSWQTNDSLIMRGPCALSWADPDGETWGPDPPPTWKSQKVFFCKTGPEPLKTKQAFNVGPAKRHLNGISLAGRWCPTFSGIGSSHLHYLKKQTKKKKTNTHTHTEKRCQCLTPSGKLSGSEHVSARERHTSNRLLLK